MIRTVVINSKDRGLSSLSSSNFYVDLNQNVSDVKAVRLHSYNMTNSVYTINSTNSTLYLHESNFQNITIVIPQKMYTPTQLATDLAALLNAATTQATVYTVVFDADLYNFTVTGTNGFFLTFQNGRVFGLSDGSAYVTSVTGGIIHFETHTAFVEISEIGQRLISTSNINFTYPLEVPGAGLNKWYYPTYQREQFDATSTLSNMRQLRIRIIDEFGNELQNNNSDIILILTVYNHAYFKP